MRGVKRCACTGATGVDHALFLRIFVFQQFPNKKKTLLQTKMTGGALRGNNSNKGPVPEAERIFIFRVVGVLSMSATKPSRCTQYVRSHASVSVGTYTHTRVL